MKKLMIYCLFGISLVALIDAFKEVLDRGLQITLLLAIAVMVLRAIAKYKN